MDKVLALGARDCGFKSRRGDAGSNPVAVTPFCHSSVFSVFSVFLSTWAHCGGRRWGSRGGWGGAGGACDWPNRRTTNRWKSLMAMQRVFLSSRRLVTAWKWFGHWLTWKLGQKSRKCDSRLALSIQSVFKIQLTHRCYHLFWTGQVARPLLRNLGFNANPTLALDFWRQRWESILFAHCNIIIHILQQIIKLWVLFWGNISQPVPIPQITVAAR